MILISILVTILSLSHADRRLLQFTTPPRKIITIPTDVPNPIVPALPVPTQHWSIPYIPPMTTSSNSNPNANIPINVPATPINNGPPVFIPTGTALEPVIEKKCDIPYPELGTCARTSSIISPTERFLLLCSNFGACAGSNITLNYPKGGWVERIQGIWLTETYAAKNAVITINNQQPNREIKIQTIQCSGAYACVGTTFVFKGGVSVADFKCTNEEYCRDCEIKGDINDYIGVPCALY